MQISSSITALWISWSRDASSSVNPFRNPVRRMNVPPDRQMPSPQNEKIPLTMQDLSSYTTQAQTDFFSHGSSRPVHRLTAG